MFRQGQLAVQGLAILLGRIEAGISNKGKFFLHEPVHITSGTDWNRVASPHHRPDNAYEYAAIHNGQEVRVMGHHYSARIFRIGGCHYQRYADQTK